jgi:hypothetical protein
MAFRVSHEKSLNKQLVQELLDRSVDIVKIENFINLEVYKGLIDHIRHFPKQLNIADGCFFPLPYSTIRKDQATEAGAFSLYQESQKTLVQFEDQTIKQISERFIAILENEAGCKPLVVYGNKKLNPIGFRVLYAGKKGIDIHCENAFLNQLEDNFKEELLNHVDLENAISIFVTISAPEKGGRLMMFDKEWEDVKINVNETAYDERHDSEGSIFTNRQLGKANISYHTCQEAEAVIFRAAQIWHGIEQLEGNKDRISIGCFIAKGNDGNFYYWS